MTRQQANRAIAGIVLEQIEKHPELRLSQLMVSLDLVKTLTDPVLLRTTWVDEFNLEPEVLLKRVKEAAARLDQANKS